MNDRSNRILQSLRYSFPQTVSIRSFAESIRAFNKSFTLLIVVFPPTILYFQSRSYSSVCIVYFSKIVFLSKILYVLYFLRSYATKSFISKNHEFETIVHMFDEKILTHLESGGEYRRIEASVAWPSGLRRWI